LTPSEKVNVLASFATFSALMSESELNRVSPVLAPGDVHSFPPAAANAGARGFDCSSLGRSVGGTSTTAVRVGEAMSSADEDGEWIVKSGRQNNNN